MQADWSKGGRSYKHAGTLRRPRTMTKARDLEDGADWLSGACDLGCKHTMLRTYQLRR